MTDHTTRDSTEIEPMVPEMPRDRSRADGGELQPSRDRSRQPEPPTSTDHVVEYDRDCEEIEPLVEQLAGPLAEY